MIDGQPVSTIAAGSAIRGNWGRLVASRVVHRFANDTERDAKWTGVPKGSLCVSNGVVQQFGDNGWDAPFFGQLSEADIGNSKSVEVGGDLIISGVGAPSGEPSGVTLPWDGRLIVDGALECKRFRLWRTTSPTPGPAHEWESSSWGWVSEGRYSGATSLYFNVSAIGTGSGNEIRCESDGRLLRSTSTRDIKDNIEDFDTPSVGLKLNPVEFRSINGPDYLRSGFIAEEAADVDARLAQYGADDEPDNIDMTAIISSLVAVCRNHQARIEALKDAA